jgi:hypothetical protein
MVLAIIADALQIVIFPLFVGGALSPADDVLDLAIAAVLVKLLGWHWEFLPSFIGKLVPGVDLVPFWTLAVSNVYRKSKPIADTTDESRKQGAGKGAAALVPASTLKRPERPELRIAPAKNASDGASPHAD